DAGDDPRAIVAALRAEGVADPMVELVWLPESGRMVFERRLPPPMMEDVRGLAMRAHLVSERVEFPQPDPFGGPPPADVGRPPGDGAGFGGPPPGGPGEDRGPGFGGPPGGPPGDRGPAFDGPGDAPPFGRRVGLELLASQALSGHPGPRGVVAA